MANAREIQNRIKSIQDTMKITRAMYMMSSMKLRKAKQKLEDTEPYFFELQGQISNILYHFPDMQHLYFDNREKDKRKTVKKKGYIVMTGDKGMAGAYNHNVLKEAQALTEHAENYHMYVVGEIGRNYLYSRNYPVAQDFCFSATNPSIHRARVIAEYIMDLYNREQLDEVDIIFTRMVNSMKEEVEVHQLLPLKTRELQEKEHNELSGNGNSEDLEGANDWFLIYPTPKKVLKQLVYNYVTGFLYGALVESTASEENARMMAMQSATNNAEVMLKDLSIQYNRIRQAAITQEITEVIGGAKALKKKKEKQKEQRDKNKCST